MRKSPIMLLLTLLAACGGAATPTETPTRIPVTVNIVVPSETPIPTATEPPTITPTPCSVPDDWEPYAVQAGDTLLRIATEAGTTVDNLVANNCLADPNALALGQTILLPPQ